MEKIKSFFRTHRQTIGFALLSATLPMLCVFIILFLRGVILRGDASLFSSAFAPSLLSAIAEAKEMGNGLLSFSRFRYNGDIFVLLASLFPASPQNSAIFSVMLCAGLTALSFYFTATGFGFGKKASSVLSVLYAVNAYAFVSLLVVGASSLLFVLPILMLTEHRLIQKGNLFPFALVLSFAFLLHIRFAWICLMAVVIWFFYDTFGLSHETAKKSCLKTLIRLGISFAVALCVGIANLTKGFQSLKFSPDITLQANFDFLSFFAKMMPTVYDGIHTDSLPYICFGLLPLLVLPLYFSSDAFTKRERIASGLVLLGLFLSMTARAIGCGVDLFGQDALPVYTQTAIFGFYALFLSAKALSAPKTDNHGPVFIAYGFLSFLLVIVQKLSLAYQVKDAKATAVYAVDAQNIWVTLFLLTALVFALHSFLKQKGKRMASVVAFCLLATVCCEAVYGQLKLLKSFQTEYPYYARHELNAYYDAYGKSGDALKEKAEIGYRAEKMHSLFAGENAFLGLSGVDTLGCEDMLGLLGGKITESGTMYQSGIPALDALLSVKYLSGYHPTIEETDEEEKADTEKKGTLQKIKEALFPEDAFVREWKLPQNSPSRLYRYVDENELYTLWNNPYALSLLSSYSGDGLKDLDFSFPTEADLLKNEEGDYVLPETFARRKNILYTPVERLNAVWSELSGKNVNLFNKLTDVQGKPVLVNFHNCSNTTDTLGHVIYTANTGKTNPYVNFSVTMSKEAEVFMCLPAMFGREADVYCNNTLIGTVNPNNKVGNGMLSLGKIEAGKIMNVEVHFKTDKGYPDFYLLKDPSAGDKWASSLFYVADEEAFLSMMDSSAFGTFEIEQCRNSLLTGRLTPSHGQTAVFTSLAYSNGTRVKIDGKRVDTYEVAGGLLGFDLPDDKPHDIHISSKREKTVPLYTAVSAVGVTMLALLLIYDIVGKERLFAFFKKYLPRKAEKTFNL